MRAPTRNRRHRFAGFTLVEVALALGVGAFCMVAVFGLVPIGVSSDNASFEQTGAANVATAVVSDLCATGQFTPPVDQVSPRYQIPVPGVPRGAVAPVSFFVRQDGTLSGTMNQDADPAQAPRFRVTLWFIAAGTAGNSAAGNPNATNVRVQITWPALADGAVASVPKKFAGSFETIAGLVRN